MNRFLLARMYTEKYKSQIAICPYCRGSNLNIVSDRFLGKNVWSVDCADCGDCGAVSTSVRESIRKWNERSEQLIKDGIA